MLNDTLDGYTASALTQDSTEIVSELKIKAEEGLRFGNIGAGTTQGMFNITGLPSSLNDFVVDSQGNIILASNSSSDSYSIYKITPNGDVTVLGVSQYQPEYIAINNEDTVFFLNASGNVTRLKTNGDKEVMPFNQGGIRALITNNTGDAFVLNYGTGEIVKFPANYNAGGTVSVIFTVPSGQYPYMYDLKLGTDGYFYTPNNGTHDVWKIAPDGSTFSILGVAQYAPQALCISPNDGYVYTAVSSGNPDTGYEPVIFKMAPDGSTSSVYAYHDFNSNSGRYEMLIDSNDIIYLSTDNVDYIWKFVPNQDPVKVVTTGSKPARIFIDNSDNLYVLNLGSVKSITAFLPMPVSKFLSVDSDGNVIDLDDIVTTGTDIIMNKNINLKVTGDSLGINIANVIKYKSSKVDKKLPSITTGSTSFEFIRIDIYDNVWSYNTYTGYLYKNDSNSSIYIPNLNIGSIRVYCAGYDGFMYLVLHDNGVLNIVKVSQDMTYKVLPNSITGYYSQFSYPALVAHRPETNEILIQGPLTNLIIYSLETYQFIVVNNPNGTAFINTQGNETVKDKYGNIYYYGPNAGYMMQIKVDNTINVLNYGDQFGGGANTYYFDKNGNNIYYSDGHYISGIDITDPDDIKHIDKYDGFELGDYNTSITGMIVDYDDRLYLTLSGGNFPNGGLYCLNEDLSTTEVKLIDDTIQGAPISLRKSVNGTFVTEYEESAVSLKIRDFNEVLNLNSDGYLNYSVNRLNTTWVDNKVKNEIEKLPLLDSGIYSPTASNTTNVNNIQFLTGVYTRVGQICTVHISYQVTASASNALTAFQIGLPFRASGRTVNIGSGALVDVLGDVGPISAQLDDQMASILCKSISQNTATANVTLVYEVL